MVRYKQGDFPPMTEERKAELKALMQRPDSAFSPNGAYFSRPASSDARKCLNLKAKGGG